MENKSFGIKLAELRKTKGMTQLDLADKLGVTDKAVSKWERDLAYPEVENLIKISDLFGVSLDSLLRGEDFSSSDIIDSNVNNISENPQHKKENSDSTRKIIGTVLLSFGAMTFLIFSLWAADILGPLLFALPFLLCGGICLIFRKRLGLFCSWAVFLSVCLYLGYASGVSLGMGLIFRTIVSLTLQDQLTIQTIMSWSIWLIYLALVIWTAFSFRNEAVSRKKIICIIAISAIVFVLLGIFSSLWAHWVSEPALRSSALRFLNRVFISFIGIARYLSIAVFVTAIFNFSKNRKRLKKN